MGTVSNVHRTFLTINEHWISSPINYKLLSNLASQQTPAKGVNALTLDEIVEYMKGQFDPTRYVVRERFKY